VHVPTLRADTTLDVSEQFAVPLETELVTVPVPEPPRTDTMMPVYKSPLVVAIERADCDALPNVTVVTAELA
jgi:hypothetical protein